MHVVNLSVFFYVLKCYDCHPGEAEKEEMRKRMKEELLAQMEFNAQSMMSWDEKVTILYSLCRKKIYICYSPAGRSVLGKLCPRSQVRPAASGRTRFFPIQTDQGR